MFRSPGRNGSLCARPTRHDTKTYSLRCPERNIKVASGVSVFGVISRRIAELIAKSSTQFANASKCKPTVDKLAKVQTRGRRRGRKNCLLHTCEMLYCEFCERSFYEGEEITIRSVAGTETMYHHGCWLAYSDELRKVAAAFGPEFDQQTEVPIQFYSRIFHSGQILDQSQEKL